MACLQERSQHLRGHAVEVVCGSRSDGAELPRGPGTGRFDHGHGRGRGRTRKRSGRCCLRYTGAGAGAGVGVGAGAAARADLSADAGVGAASLLELAVFGWAAGFRRLNLKPPSDSDPETRFFAGGGAGNSDTRLRRVERPPAGGSTKFTLLRRVCGIPLGPTGPQHWQPHAL